MAGIITWLTIFGIAAAMTITVVSWMKPQAVHITGPSEPSRSISDEKPKATAPSEESQMRPLPPTLPESVTAWDHDTMERNQWCERVLKHIYQDRHHGRYNVIGINTALEYYVNLDGIVEEFELLYKSKPSKKGRLVNYRYIVFEKGEAMNLGDGGPINWVWSGTYTRTGLDIVSFQERRK